MKSLEVKKLLSGAVLICLILSLGAVSFAEFEAASAPAVEASAPASP